MKAPGLKIVVDDTWIKKQFPAWLEQVSQEERAAGFDAAVALIAAGESNPDIENTYLPLNPYGKKA